MRYFCIMQYTLASIGMGIAGARDAHSTGYGIVTQIFAFILTSILWPACLTVKVVSYYIISN